MKQLTLGEYYALSVSEKAAFLGDGYHKPKCLMTVAPGKWNHPEARNQVRLVAAWCNCEKCYNTLFDYFKGYPNGQT